MSLRQQRTAYRESLRQEILDAARELFVRDGYEATSIRRIADKVDCSPGILYHYFKDKPEIMAQLIRETFVKLHGKLSAILNDSAPSLELLRRGLRKYIEFGLDHPHHYAILFTKPHTVEKSVEMRAVFESDGMKCFGTLRAICRRCLDEGLLRPELQDEEEIAQALWASLHGLISVVTNAKGFPFIEQSRLVDRLVDILVCGVKRH
jgi:AcrR family transcriptional regulator